MGWQESSILARSYKFFSAHQNSWLLKLSILKTLVMEQICGQSVLFVMFCKYIFVHLHKIWNFRHKHAINFINENSKFNSRQQNKLVCSFQCKPNYSKNNKNEKYYKYILKNGICRTSIKYWFIWNFKNSQSDLIWHNSSILYPCKRIICAALENIWSLMPKYIQF